VYQLADVNSTIKSQNNRLKYSLETTKEKGKKKCSVRCKRFTGRGKKVLKKANSIVS